MALGMLDVISKGLNGQSGYQPPTVESGQTGHAGQDGYEGVKGKDGSPGTVELAVNPSVEATIKAGLPEALKSQLTFLGERLNTKR